MTSFVLWRMGSSTQTLYWAISCSLSDLDAHGCLMNAKAEVCDCGKSHHPLGIKGELARDCMPMNFGALGQFLSTLQVAVCGKE